MSGGNERTVLVDASVFICLANIGAVDLLSDADGHVTIPAAVEAEIVDEPAVSRLITALNEGKFESSDPPRIDSVHTAAQQLGRELDSNGVPGEENAEIEGDVALIAHAMDCLDPVVVTDDKPLRNTCKALSIPLSGSIGLVIRAAERGDLDPDEAKDTLYAMDEVGARLSATLVRRAEKLIEAAAGGPDEGK